MSEFKPITTQEEFERRLSDRLEQKERSVSKKYEGYISPEKLTEIKNGYEGQITTLQFNGVKSRPLDPLALSLTLGAGFVARGFSGDLPHLVELMKQAIMFKGYAHVDILQPCVVWNKVNTFS